MNMIRSIKNTINGGYKSIIKEFPVSIICSVIASLGEGILMALCYIDTRSTIFIEELIIFSFFFGVGILPIEAYKKFKKEANNEYKDNKSTKNTILLIIISVFSLLNVDLLLTSENELIRIKSVFGINVVSDEKFYEIIMYLMLIFIAVYIIATSLMTLYFFYKNSNMTFARYVKRIFHGVVTAGFLFFLITIVTIILVLTALFMGLLSSPISIITILIFECYFGFIGIIIYPVWLYILSGEKS